jgi:transcriptional regulator with XRE-family HTH domain
MKPSRHESAMENARNLFAKSGKKLEEVGLLMGYKAGLARRSTWQFLNKTTDPRLSMLCRFADAMGVDVRELLG